MAFASWTCWKWLHVIVDSKIFHLSLCNMNIFHNSYNSWESFLTYSWLTDCKRSYFARRRVSNKIAWYSYWVGQKSFATGQKSLKLQSYMGKFHGKRNVASHTKCLTNFLNIPFKESIPLWPNIYCLSSFVYSLKYKMNWKLCITYLEITCTLWFECVSFYLQNVTHTPQNYTILGTIFTCNPTEWTTINGQVCTTCESLNKQMQDFMPNSIALIGYYGY